MVKFRTVNDEVLYFISPSGKKSLKEEDINKYLKQKNSCKWINFDNLKKISIKVMVSLNQK